MDAKALAKMIDHTCLKPTADQKEIAKLCAEARQYGFRTVCVPPFHVEYAIRQLQGSEVKVCTVIGFPLGYDTAAAKAFAAQEAVRQGAEEVDMVIAIGALKAGRLDTVEADIAGVVRAAGGKTVKVILETAYLTDDEKVAACYASQRAGARFVKTSTGFGPGGATVEDIRLLRQTVGAAMEVKASGGIRDLAATLAMVDAGADRIGTSSGPAIIEELLGQVQGGQSTPSDY